MYSPDFSHYHFTVAERFLRYVQINTQADPFSSATPSTPGQKDLGRLLLDELHQMGLEAEMDAYGYVYATLPSNQTHPVPVICFCAHMDTSPDCSGEGVKPIVHRNYQGEDLVLPDDPAQIIRMEDFPELQQQIGNDIITASGTTLLGADDKSGIAIIMDALHYWISHPEQPHGEIRILFTVDEEIGRGVDHVDLQKLRADVAYTLDGESAGHLEDENFCADQVVVQIHGISAHTGYACGKMVNAMKLAAAVIDNLPGELSPEATSGKQGFIHPLHIEGNVETTTIHFLIRHFEENGLKAYEQLLEGLVKQQVNRFPGAKYEWKCQEQYRNMKYVLDQHPEVVRYAEEAIRRAGLQPVHHAIRGGTDGARLSFMSLPCPNLFTGQHAFHSKKEWISIQDMQKAVQTLVHLAEIWATR
ncbi:peptidase T [Thermoflavifilum thermophilum]|uniref:Peptidase T n=1 Tax=Thermoflavifilum thermophilum TaxID=1393122 RepID=A0A1I7NHP6_9BACT|nr:peptidase T [Thermoflavifilum thermophilum]SFV34195.1 tripeptide aminopeptidase [Thermoflavifilum thermophilum]